MKLNHTKTEKENIILQLKEDLTRLGVTEVGLPESVSDYTVGAVSALPDVEDNGDDSKVIPNASVTISFKDTAKAEKTHTTTFNYKRLDVNLLKEKRQVEKEPGKEYVFQSAAYEENLKVLDEAAYNTKLTEKLKEKLQLPVDVTPTSTPKLSSKELFLKGVVEYEFSAHDNSLTTRGKVVIPVETRSPDHGELQFKTEDGKLKSYYFKGTSSFRQETREVNNTDGKFDEDMDELSPANRLVLPQTMTALPAGFAHGMRQPVNLDTTPPPNLTTINTGAFNHLSNVRLVDNNSLEDNYSIQHTGPMEFFKNISSIGEGALVGLSFNSTQENPVVFGTENLQLEGSNVLGSQCDLRYAKVASEQALPKILRQSAHIEGLEFTKTHEAGKAAVDSEDYSTYGYLKFVKGGETCIVYITADDVEKTIVSPATNELSALHLLSEYKLPDTVSDYPTNFLRKATIDTVTAQVGETYKQGSFADTTISKLVVDLEDTTIDTLVEEGAFKNATISTIEVKNNKVKAKLEAKLNALANTPTWKVKETTSESSPVVEGEVPAEVVSSGLNYDEV